MSRNPLCSQAATMAVVGISPTRTRHRAMARHSATSSARPVRTASPSASAPVTAASNSAAVRVRSASPSTRSPGVPRKLSATRARRSLSGLIATTSGHDNPGDIWPRVRGRPPLWTTGRRLRVLWTDTSRVARSRYHSCMTNAMTVRLDDETSQELAELAERHPSRSAAVQAAIHQAWQHLQEEKLQAGYAAAVAENPHYPYDSAEEAAVLRARRRARQARDSAA